MEIPDSSELLGTIKFAGSLRSVDGLVAILCVDMAGHILNTGYWGTA